MECVVVILVVLGIGISIVVAAFRKAEEERQRNQMRPGPRGQARRPGGTDLDRFLEEARRRREAGAGQPPPRPAAEAPWAVPVNRPATRRQTDVRPPRPGRQTPERAPAPTPSRPAPRQTMSMGFPPAPPPVPQTPVVLELIPDDAPATPAQPAQPTSLETPMSMPPAAVKTGTPSVAPAALKQLPGMLRKPQTLATAFALGVIFGPPVSRRSEPRP